MTDTYSKEEVKKASLEYFNNDNIATDVYIKKYAMKNKEGDYIEKTPDDTHKRMAKAFSKIEKKFPNSMSEKEILGLLSKYRYIIPGGSPTFGIGNPTQMVSLSNCFVVDCMDSYGGICRSDERIAQISKRRGGVGIDISSIRPRGMKTNNSSMTTDGISIFMDRFSNTIREVGQHGRRGALMISISVHHPEIMEFINIKKDRSRVTGANISVRVSDEFMKAVHKDKEYEQRWPVDSSNPSVSQKVQAKEVWDALIDSNYGDIEKQIGGGEPGILFWDTIIRNSPADCYADKNFKTISTNPCLVGETLVYTADGRGNVSIKELADEGKDVPVFCYDDKGKIAVRTMRHPRITGYGEKIYKVTLDDGNIIRATGNHKLLTTDGEYKAIEDIKEGESLKILTKFEAPMPASIKAESGSRSKTLYNWISNKIRGTRAEHRYIAEYIEQRELNQTEIVHHKDYNGLNNSHSNLEVMSMNSHNKLHAKDMMGDKNPMRRAKDEWLEEKWQQYHDNMSKAVSGDKNGRFTGQTHEQVKEHAIELTQYLGYRFSKKEWQEYARSNQLPIEFSDWRKDSIGSVLDLAKWAAIECELKYINEDPRLVKTLKSMIEQGYKSYIEGNQVFVEKTCEECGKKFIKEHRQREVGLCSRTCANLYLNKHGVNDKRASSINSTYKEKAEEIMHKQLKIFTKLKFELSKMPMMKDWENECRKNNIPFRLKTKHGFKSYKELKEKAETFNHRVVSVEFDGYEDVYNGTVDDFHNFFIGGFEGLTKSKSHKSLYLNNLNCGELPLCNLDSCRLMSMNIASYIVNPYMEDAYFDWDLFVEHVGKAMRLMDDLVEMEIEAVTKIIDKIKKDPEPDYVKHNELSMWKEIKEKCENGRRTGLGLTGLADAIASLNIKYGEKESIKVVDKVYKVLRDESYRASIEMAKERGSFPIWNTSAEKDNVYLNRLPDDIKIEMAKYGRRNIGLLTTPPAGSISITAQVSNSGEPVYQAQYYRKRKLMDGEDVEPDFIDDNGDKWQEYTIQHQGLKRYIDATGKTYEDSPYFKTGALDIDPMVRVKMQAVATQYVDHAISSTINLHRDTPKEVLSELYKAAWKSGCKGLTTYRDGTRDGIMTTVSAGGRKCDDCDDASKMLIELIEQGKRPQNVILSTSPTRAKILPCDIHRSKVGGGDWLFFVGIHNNQPYEIFGGNMAEFSIPHKYKSGWIEKNGKVEGITQYNLILGSLEDQNERLEFKGIAKHFNHYEYGAFTRLASLTMRHGTPIKYICEQITKKGVEGDLFSFQRAMARILKKYIIEGEKSGIECPDCGSPEMIYRNGCPACMVCGASKCS